VAELVNEEFGVQITRQLVRKYNPEQNPGVADKWKVIFAETRKKFLASVAEIGIAHQNYRLAELQRLYDKAGKNLVLKCQILEQAAKEMGGVYTSKRQLVLSARDGLAELLGCSPDELPVPLHH
jgi:hypothetical protein